MKQFVLAIILISFAVVPVVSCAQESFQLEAETVMAPDVLLKTKDGADQSLLAFIKDQKAILFFWATWCPHCRTQLKELDAKRDVMKAQGVRVVLIDIGEKPAKALKFLEEKGYTFDILFDPDASAADIYGVVGVPTMVVIGKDGTARALMNELPEDYLALLQ